MLALGLSIYFANALWSALFIVTPKMDRDWCKEAIDFGTGDDALNGDAGAAECMEFKSVLERLKYENNIRMRDRNRYWVYGTYGAGMLAGLLFLYVLPKRRGASVLLQDISASMTLGFIAVLLVPPVLAAILPAPYKWAPRVLTDYALHKEAALLQQLKKLARESDQR